MPSARYRGKYKAIKVNGKKYDEHRYVLEQHIGRPLLATEVVRHRDRNTLNNDISNLYIVTRQQQWEEQLAEGTLAENILKAYEDRRNGVLRQPKPKVKAIKPAQPPKPRKKRPPTISPKAAIAKEKKKEPTYGGRRGATYGLSLSVRDSRRSYKTRQVDYSSQIAVRLDHKTIVFVPSGTEVDIEHLREKYKRPELSPGSFRLR